MMSSEPQPAQTGVERVARLAFRSIRCGRSWVISNGLISVSRRNVGLLRSSACPDSVFKLANPGGRSIAKLRNTQDFSRCVFDLPSLVGQIIAKTPANLSREEGRIAIVTDV